MKAKPTALLVLDLDGTVRKGKDQLGRFVNNARDVEIFPEVVPLMREWKKRGGRIVGATNQGGIALGIVSKDDVIESVLETHKQCQEMFDQIGICQHHPEAKEPAYSRCWCRKPSPGLVIDSCRTLNYAYNEVYPPHMGLFVGDSVVDEECAEILNMDFMWAEDWRMMAGGSMPSYARSSKIPKVTDSQKHLLDGLVRAGGSGIFDRYVRIVAAGEVLTKAGSTVALNAFRRKWIRMRGERVEITSKGRELLQS